MSPGKPRTLGIQWGENEQGLDSMALTLFQGGLDPFIPSGLDSNHLNLSYLHGLILLVANPLSETSDPGSVSPLWMPGLWHQPQAFPQPQAQSLFFPRSAPSPPAFHRRRQWELGLSPQHPCGQAKSAKARCILKGSVHDLSTYIFPRQLVDQKNKLCLISLISSKVMPRKALKHILFLFCICNSIIWLGIGCQWVIKQYFLTLHYVWNIVLDVRVESLEKSGFIIVILQKSITRLGGKKKKKRVLALAMACGPEQCI